MALAIFAQDAAFTIFSCGQETPSFNISSQSLVRGGHNFMNIRFSSREIQASVKTTDYLLALNAESIGLRKKNSHRPGHGMPLRIRSQNFQKNIQLVGESSLQHPPILSVHDADIGVGRIQIKTDVTTHDNTSILNFKIFYQPD